MKKTSLLTLLSLTLAVFLAACAGPNPNPGERTVDRAWLTNKFDQAFNTVKPFAEAGEPWAQLRLGIFYENGWGTPENKEQAEFWYKKAAAQKASGEWAEGKAFGATGKIGFFNQNSDARIAQFNLAQLYYDQGKNLAEAKKLVDTVILESNGQSIFFCCEFAGGRYFYPKDFQELKQNIEKKLADPAKKNTP